MVKIYKRMFNLIESYEQFIPSRSLQASGGFTYEMKFLQKNPKHIFSQRNLWSIKKIEQSSFICTHNV